PDRDDTGGAVDEGRLRERGEPLERQRLTGYGPRPADLARCAGVGSQHDIRIEDGEQAVEVAGPGGGQERVDDIPLADEVAVGFGRAVVHAAPGPAGQLPGCGR